MRPSSGSALAGANGITVVVQVPAHATRLGVVARGVPHPPFLALAAQSGGFERPLPGIALRALRVSPSRAVLKAVANNGINAKMDECARRLRRDQATERKQ